MENTLVNLAELVRREVEDYARAGWANGEGFAVSDLQRQTYVVTFVPSGHPRPFRANIVVMARVVGDTVLIDEDITDRPLWEELVRAGIPRERIVLLYAGERLEQPTT